MGPNIQNFQLTNRFEVPSLITANPLYKTFLNCFPSPTSSPLFPVPFSLFLSLFTSYINSNLPSLLLKCYGQGFKYDKSHVRGIPVTPAFGRLKNQALISSNVQYIKFMVV